MSEENVEVVRRGFEAFSQNDFEGWYAVTSTNVKLYPRREEPGVKDSYEGWARLSFLSPSRSIRLPTAPAPLRVIRPPSCSGSAGLGLRRGRRARAGLWVHCLDRAQQPQLHEPELSGFRERRVYDRLSAASRRDRPIGVDGGLQVGEFVLASAGPLEPVKLALIQRPAGVEVGEDRLPERLPGRPESLRGRRPLRLSHQPNPLGPV
jgi:hypothetical protein